MGLTSFNLPGKNISSDKQMAMMRNYINQLKDETETELFDIKWENLSKTLRDKINSLENDITATSESGEETAQNVNTISASLITADEVKAIIGTFNYITADYIITGTVLTNTVAAAIINTNSINATYATVGALNAAVARIGAIETGYLKTDKLWSNDSWITRMRAQTVYGTTVSGASYKVNGLPAEAGDLGWIQFQIGTRTFYAIGSEVDRSAVNSASAE